MKSGRFPHDVLFDVQVENTPVDIDFVIMKENPSLSFFTLLFGF